jgi:hypothetical protein
MTKREAYKQFRELYGDAWPGRRDIPARNEAWGVFTDSLCKSGKITLKQYETWTYPFKEK